MDLDIRCSAVWADASTELDDARCQLVMGHELAHAVIVAAAGTRELWLWRQGAIRKLDTRQGLPHQLPWAPGMPKTCRSVTRLTTQPAPPAEPARRSGLLGA